MNADLSDRRDIQISRVVQAALDTLSDDIYNIYMMEFGKR